MSDVEGREKVEDLIERRRIVDVPTPVVAQLTVHKAVLQWTMGTSFWQFIQTISAEKA